MELDLVQRYVHAARDACQACVDGLGLSRSGSDLSVLLRAARTQKIDRRGAVRTSGGGVYEYHVHGTGYSFKNLSTGAVTHFDLMPCGGVDLIRFSPWKLHQYALSVGESISEETVALELQRLSGIASYIEHVVDGPFDYYYCTEDLASAGKSTKPGSATVNRVMDPENSTTG